MAISLRRYVRHMPLIFGLLMIAGSVIMIARSPRSSAAEQPVCYAAMVVDRSGSVDNDQLETMRQNILRLFDPGGVRSPNVKLAFWSFSSTFNNTNYDAPFSPFVDSDTTAGHDSFYTSLYQINSGGGTDYEQGFGYDGYSLNNQKINTRDNIDETITKANVLVFMTDGVPNTPGSGGDNNSVARQAARGAVQKLQQAATTAGRQLFIIGGLIGNLDNSSLDYAINGYGSATYRSGSSRSNPPNIFAINSDYSQLTQVLTNQINVQCAKVVPPVDAPAYSLTPTVTSTNTVVSGTDAASFSYNVNNSSDDGASDTTNWSIKRVLVDRGQPVDPLAFGGRAYRDGYSCDQLEALINGNGVCSNVTDGRRAFSKGNTSLDMDAGNATNVILDDNWPVGTKLCYVLTIEKPTQKANPTDRYSRATCLTIGKRPLVQVHGGDLIVGRHFVTDGADEETPDNPSDPARVVTSITPKANGRTYGSWSEYGVFSPGLVVGFASLSGFEGGYESTLPNTQEFWSKLTFANTDNEYGLFTEGQSGQGTIPNVRGAILAGQSIKRDLTGIDSIDLNGADLRSGLYQKNSGSLELDASILEKGKSVIINVPNGKVTITGNVSYFDGPYTNMDDIPQLIILAKRIVIAEDVTHVSAWLISDDKDDGTVSTCDNPATLTSQICNQQLTIDGPIMARHLDLRRTGGAGPGGASGDPAEIINLPADAYLWSQGEGRSDTRVQTTFTTELPPYF